MTTRWWWSSRKIPGNSAKPRDQAVALYYAVRDGVRYNPYVFSRDPQTLKAILLAACARHCRIPARIGLADVRNHLATPRLLEALRSEVFAMHGYTELYLEGRWVKATPAFNRALCRAFDVAPLEFDGVADSVFHPFNRQGERYMEYLADHGQFADLPEELFFSHLQQHYPHLFSGRPLALDGDFQAEAGQDEGRR